MIYRPFLTHVRRQPVVTIMIAAINGSNVPGMPEETMSEAKLTLTAALSVQVIQPD